MRNLIIYLSALSSLFPADAFKHPSSQLRDLLAYPKYEIQFLNDLPLSSSDAKRAKQLGVEREEEWMALRLGSSDRRKLGDGSDDIPLDNRDRLGIMPMRLTPPGTTDMAEYLCLMPSKNSTEGQTAQADDVDEHTELDPAQSWAALSHLEGKCLYSRQGWFTYSYCHNSHIRQFKAADHPHPHPPGGYEPKEDQEYDAYTLGQAHPPPSPRRARAALPPGKPDAQPNTNAHPAQPPSTNNQSPNPDVSFGLSTTSRYLVQRWSEGTPCDKTGKPREIEIQVHCSMTTNDIIYMVKEMAICQYVMIIHSPHLCGLAGFKPPQADVQAAGIRCRQVVEDEDWEGFVSGNAGEEDGKKETLRLPWGKAVQEKPPGWSFEDLATPPKDGDNDDDENVLGKINDGALQNLLQQALEMIANQRTASAGDGQLEGEEGIAEEVMLVSWEEDGEGGVRLDANIILNGEEGEVGSAVGMEKEEKEMILELVREYLQGKSETKMLEPEEEEGEEFIGDRGHLADEL